MNALMKDETIWEEQWVKLFGGQKPEWLSWREAVQQIHRAVKRFGKDSECILWAIEHEHESLVERMVRNRPRLVTSPRHRDRLPLYTASQTGNAYVPTLLFLFASWVWILRPQTLIVDANFGSCRLRASRSISFLSILFPALPRCCSYLAHAHSPFLCADT